MDNIKIILLTGHDKSILLSFLIKQDLEITALVLPKSKKYEPLYEKTKEIAIKNNINVIQTKPSSIYNAVCKLKFDILFSCGYPFKIPESVLKITKYPINFHPSLLPKHRGRYLHWILIDKDEFSGVTAHIIDNGYDTGPIIDNIKFKVSAFDTVKSLKRKSLKLELDLMKKIIERIRNNSLSSILQNNSIATEHFKKRTPADSEINPSKPLSELFFEIRSCDHELYPAFFFVEGQKVGIKLFRLDKPEGEEDMI